MANEKRLIQRSFAHQHFKVLAKRYEGSFTGDAFERAAKEIAEMPGVDAVEVVHSEWLNTKFTTELLCGNCFALSYMPITKTGRKPYNYCPNCGADMRGDGDG